MHSRAAPSKARGSTLGLIRSYLPGLAGSELHSALRERGDGSVSTELVVVGGSDLTERKALLKVSRAEWVAVRALARGRDVTLQGARSR